MTVVVRGAAVWARERATPGVDLIVTSETAETAEVAAQWLRYPRWPSSPTRCQVLTWHPRSRSSWNGWRWATATAPLQ